MSAATGLDIFSTDPAFSMISLTDAFIKIPFVPGQVGKLGIFTPKPITTTDVAIEELDGSLAIIPAVNRGGPPNQNQHAKRKLRKIDVPHLPLEDTIQASEVQNVREFGTMDTSQGVQSVVNLRLMEMGKKHDATIEYQRINALQGRILDADGETVLVDLYETFGVEQPSVDLNLGDDTGALVDSATSVADTMDTELGGMAYDYPYAFLGSQLWSKFIGSADVRAAYQYFQANGQNLNPLRDDLRYTGFMYGGVIWEKYRGSINGIPFVSPSEGIAFPIGADIYRTYYAPADFWETVNTLGLPRYAKQVVNELGTAVKIYTESNPLCITLRPAAHVKLFSST